MFKQLEEITGLVLVIIDSVKVLRLVMKPGVIVKTKRRLVRNQGEDKSTREFSLLSLNIFGIILLLKANTINVDLKNFLPFMLTELDVPIQDVVPHLSIKSAYCHIEYVVAVGAFIQLLNDSFGIAAEQKFTDLVSNVRVHNVLDNISPGFEEREL
jgi:hypothetical protein